MEPTTTGGPTRDERCECPCGNADSPLAPCGIDCAHFVRRGRACYHCGYTGQRLPLDQEKIARALGASRSEPASSSAGGLVQQYMRMKYDKPPTPTPAGVPERKGLTAADLMEMARGVEKRLLAEGDPFNGDDYEAMQIARGYLAAEARVAELEAERDKLQAKLSATENLLRATADTLAESESQLATTRERLADAEGLLREAVTRFTSAKNGHEVSWAGVQLFLDRAAAFLTPEPPDADPK